MKVFVICAAILALATSYPVVKTWTFMDLMMSALNFQDDPSTMPFLEYALKIFTAASLTGKAETWTINELTQALADPNTRPEYRESLTEAYSRAKNEKKTSVPVAVLAIDLSKWCLSDLNDALASPNTKADLIPYLEDARTTMKQDLLNGQKRDTITILTPIGLITPKSNSHPSVRSGSLRRKARVYKQGYGSRYA